MKQFFFSIELKFTKLEAFQCEQFSDIFYITVLYNCHLCLVQTYFHPSSLQLRQLSEMHAFCLNFLFSYCPQDPTYTERFHFSALCLCTWSSLCWECVGTVPPLTPPWPGSLPLSFRIMQKHQFLQETFPDPHALAQVRAGCSS